MIVGLVTLIFWLKPGISHAPILWDRAYFTVLEQAMLRGESIYDSSFMGYPPFGMMVAAGTMWIGQLFAV